jgi:protein-S-isoprenylcysteine O-methyltransferase Ste14
MDALKTVLVGLALTAVFLIGIPWLILRYAGGASCSHDLTVLRLVGIGLIAGGIYLYVWSVRRLLQRQTSAIPGRAPTSLETGGWYGRVRHPLLLGIIAVLIGEAALFASLPLLAYAMTYWLWLHCFVTFKEERDLHDAFGAAYTEYMKAVPRWIPKLW